MKKKINMKQLMVVLAFLLIFAYAVSLNWKLKDFDDPLNIHGTYQLGPSESRDKPVEVIVITRENILYAYRQFHPFVKTELKELQDNLYSFEWEGTKFIHIFKHKLYYFDAKHSTAYPIKKVDDVPTFINVKEEEF